MENESPVNDQADDQTAASDANGAESATEVVEEILIEEISIDGMCGVY